MIQPNDKTEKVSVEKRTMSYSGYEPGQMFIWRRMECEQVNYLTVLLSCDNEIWSVATFVISKRPDKIRLLGAQIRSFTEQEIADMKPIGCVYQYLIF